jgi:hypothetical protein
MRSWRIIIITVVLSGMLCGGCISDSGETPSTTVPPGVDTTPILMSEAMAAMTELQVSYDSKEAELQDMIDLVQTMIDSPEPDYAELYSTFMQCHETMVEYRSILRDYYNVSILLEYTTPIEDDLMALNKDMLPFDEPEINMISFGLLNMSAQNFDRRFGTIRDMIKDGIAGQDVQEELSLNFGEFVAFLPDYYDAEIGYQYYRLNDILTRQSQYSDILIKDCNELCVSIP